MDTGFKYETLHQRKRIYQWLIQRIDMGKKFYMCITLGHRLIPKAKFYYQVMEALPELAAQSPWSGTGMNTWGAWATLNLAGMRFRRQRIIKAIQLTDRKIEKAKQHSLTKRKTSKT